MPDNLTLGREKLPAGSSRKNPTLSTHHVRMQAVEAAKQVEEAAHVTNLTSLRDQYAALEQAASDGAFWEDQESAQATLQQMSELKGIVQEVEGFQGLLGDVQTAIELAEMEAGPFCLFAPLEISFAAQYGYIGPCWRGAGIHTEHRAHD